MDTTRKQLTGASLDTFNTLSSPGQSLLQALQQSEVQRKQRYGETVDAKMKAAREKLPALHPKHAPRSDQSIFASSSPSSEVHALLPSVRPAKASMEGIKTMLMDKKSRHEAVVNAFTAARDEAKKILADEVMLQVTVLKNDISASNQEIEELLSVLDEYRVMVLTETDVHNVWLGVERQIPERAGWIDSLAEGLEVAEEQRRVKVEAALVTMVDKMGEVAHISEGEVERILEKESLSLNLDILNNRRAYADLVTRLQVSEVELEKKRKEEWASGLSRWRVLRTHQSMKALKAIIESPDFSEPPERLALFSYLRERQSSAYDSIVTHIQHVTHLAPPYLSTKRVNAWHDEANHRLDVWSRELSEVLVRISSHEEKVEAAAQNHMASMISQLLGYKGFSEEECIELADKECGSVIKQRREAALELIEKSKKFLSWQLEEWRAFSFALGNWLTSLAILFEEHKLKTNENEKVVRAQLKAKRESFEAEDAARESDLDASLAALSQGHSEQALDDLVSASLVCLDKIEGGYRDFHSAMSKVAKSFPVTVQRANANYHLQLCAGMFIKPLLAPPEPSEEELAAKAKEKAEEEARRAAEAEALRASAEAEAAASKGKKPPSESKKGAAPAPAPAPPPAAPPPATPEPPPPPSPKEVVDEIVLTDGSVFGMFKQVIDVIMDQSSEALKAEMMRRWNVLKEERRAERKAQLEREKAERDAASTPAESDMRSMKSMKKSQPPPLEASTLPTEELMEEEDNKEPEEEALSPPHPPLDLYGRPHCQSLDLPEGLLSRSFKELQVGLLRDMQEFAMLTYDKSSEWADQREAALTEELEAHLRDHRPRAGRIEEETRLGRSVELVAQRRKAEGHFRAQSKAVKVQDEQFGDWERALIAQVDKAVIKLRSYENLLGQSMSIKSIDIRKREAEALRAKIERDLEDSMVELEEKVKASCDKICDMNRSFDSSTLKTFDEGGHYSPENVAMYRQSLAGIDAHVAKTEVSQVERLKAVQADLVKKAEEALQYVLSLLPSHKEDMELLEKLDALMETAKRKAGGELGKSAKDADLINNELDNLEQLLNGAEKQQSQWKLLHSGGSTDRTDYGAPLDRCRAILSSLDRIRLMLYKQGKAFNFLQSSGLAIAQIDLSLNADGEKPSNALSSAAVPAPDAKSTGGAKAAPAPAVAPSPPPTTPGADAEALARDMEAAIDSCRREAEILAKAYYAMMFPPAAAGGGSKAKEAVKKPSSPVGAKKGATKGKEVEVHVEEDTGPKPIRPIRYPARIPLKLEDMIKWMDGILEGLRDQLNSHVAAGVKGLRTQAIRAYRLVERTPASALALLAYHELKAVGERHRSLLKKYDGQRSDLLQQVEVVRSSLHPRMTNPSCEHELESLKAAESHRAQLFSTMIASLSQEAASIIEAEGPRLRQRLAHLVGILVKLFDNLMMPDDLPPVGSDEGYIYSLPGRKDDKQLMRLMLANAEAEGTPLPPPDASGGKGGKGAVAAPAPSATSRPFTSLSWTLPSGNFDLSSLGWTLPYEKAEAAPPPAAPAAGAKKGAVASSTPSAPTDGSVIITGLDTPCHRASIRAYRSSLQHGEDAFRSNAMQIQSLVLNWNKDEALWSKTWDRLLKDLSPK